MNTRKKITLIPVYALHAAGMTHCLLASCLNISIVHNYCHIFFLTYALADTTTTKATTPTTKITPTTPTKSTTPHSTTTMDPDHTTKTTPTPSPSGKTTPAPTPGIKSSDNGHF